MGVIDQSMRSSDTRPIQLRVRRDLIIQEVMYQGETSWVVKDPVAMKFFRVQEAEKVALEMLDGNHNYRQILNALESSFPEISIRIEEVHSLINSFHTNGLLISNSPGQAAPLKAKRNKEIKQKATQLLMSLMSLKFPGVDPERFLSWLYPKVSWFFTKTCTFLCFLICLAAACLVLSNLDEFYRRLPEFQQFFNLKNIFFMAAIMIVTKSIHELGHGLMCKHFGGECHEIGFMLLVLTPAMYCNTSDSWLLPNKWHRIAIGAAGMYVEIVLAAICTFVWWYTQPGIIHYMALNAIFLCSVSTLLFNANPLLRYDGYYMLSDYLEIPNLGHKSKSAMLSKLRVWCLGMRPVNNRMMPKRKSVSFALYAVASFFYRWFIMLMIFWFIIKIFEPYGVQVIGHIMVVVSLIGMIGIPCYKLVKFFVYPGRFREVKKARFAIATALVLLLGLCVFLVPVPHKVTASFVVQPADGANIYVRQSGTLTKVNFVPGETVRKGDVIAELENIDHEIALEQLTGQLAGFNAELARLNLSNEQSSQASKLVASIKANIVATEKQVAIFERIVAELKLVATRDGQVIPPPNINQSANSGRSLATWTGTPLDTENRKAFLNTQTLYCIVADPDKMKAMLLIDQSDAKFITAGQNVSLMLDEHIGEVIKGEIEFVSRDALSQVPPELSMTNGGPIATKPSPSGIETPLIPIYEAAVSLKDSGDAKLLTGFRGQARIHVGTASLGQRLMRYVMTVINFR